MPNVISVYENSAKKKKGNCKYILFNIFRYFYKGYNSVNIFFMLTLIKFDLGSFMIIRLLNFITICATTLEKGSEMFGGSSKTDGQQQSNNG